MMTGREIHQRIKANNHKWSVNLNVWRVPTLTEVEATINNLRLKAAHERHTVESGGIIVFYNDGNLKVTYHEL